MPSMPSFFAFRALRAAMSAAFTETSGGPATAGSLAGLAAGQSQAEDGFHLRAHLAAPALARLPEHLQAADLAQALHLLQQGMQGRR